MRDTSLEAFKGIIGQLSEKRGKVFGVFFAATEPMCDFQAAKILGWPINCVTNRRGELTAMGYLMDAGVRPGPPCGYDVHYYQLRHACLKAGFEARPIERKEKRPKRFSLEDVPLNWCARRLAQARRGKKQKPVKRLSLPLFE